MRTSNPTFPYAQFGLFLPKINPVKRVITVFLGLMFLSSGWSQNRLDGNGKKHGKWIYYGKDKPTAGYKSTTKVEEGTFDHGRKSGQWTKYYTDGVTVKLQGTYVNNRPQGGYARYYPNGKLKEKGTFGNEKNQGQLIRYYSNGKIAYVSQFDANGKETGAVKHYYPNGNVMSTYTLKDGKPYGEYVQYNENGTVRFTIAINGNRAVKKVTTAPPQKTDTYSEPPTTGPPPKITNPNTKGVTFFPEGYNKVYNANDELWLDGNFQKGQLFDGKVYEYGANGLLKRVKIYKEGKFHSYSQL